MHTKLSNTQNVFAGDVNVCMEMNENSEQQKLSNTLQCFGMKNHVTLPTHKSSHTLDLTLSNEILNIIAKF